MDRDVWGRRSTNASKKRPELRPRKNLLGHTRISAVFAQFLSNATKTWQSRNNQPESETEARHSKLSKFMYRGGRRSGQDIDRAIDRLYQARYGIRIAHSNREKAVRPGLPVRVRALYSLLEAAMRISYLQQENIGPRIHHQGNI